MAFVAVITDAVRSSGHLLLSKGILQIQNLFNTAVNVGLSFNQSCTAPPSGPFKVCCISLLERKISDSSAVVVWFLCFVAT